MSEGGSPGGRRKRGSLAWLGAIYVIGFLATVTWYVVTGFTGCEARTVRGRCFDFELFVEGLVYGLIWPLHWVLELIEAISG